MLSVERREWGIERMGSPQAISIGGFQVVVKPGKIESDIYNALARGHSKKVGVDFLQIAQLDN